MVLAAIWCFELIARLVVSVSLVVLVVSALVAVHRSVLAAVAPCVWTGAMLTASMWHVVDERCHHDPQC